VLAVAEIGEGDIGRPRRAASSEDQRQPELDVAAGLPSFSSRFHLPCSPQRKPIEPLRRDELAGGLVDGDGLPVGIVGSPRPSAKSEARSSRSGTSAVLLDQLHQHRHVGVAAAIVLEILGLPVEMEFAQDDMAHRHGQRGVGALLGIQPDVAELGASE
jgi:hypothetical protein